MSDQETDGAEDQQSFAAFLCQHARGRSERELSAELRKLVEAVEETGKSGSIVYTLKITPEVKAEHAVLVSDEIRTKLPSLDRPQSIFFADQAYRLVRTDPRQMSFESFTEESA